MSVVDNLKRGTLEMLLLFLIQEKDMYAYQLAQVLETRSRGQFISSQQDGVYCALYRMAKRGFLSTRKVPLEDSKRFRIYYHLEPTGKQYLEELRREYIAINRGIYHVLGLKNLDDEE